MDSCMVINMVVGFQHMVMKNYMNILTSSLLIVLQNVASITHYFESVIATLNYRASSASRNTTSTTKASVPFSSAFFVKYNIMNYTNKV